MGVKKLLIASHFRILIEIPLNNGQHCPTAPITPRPVNCPIASSINRSGIPQIKSVMKYGNKKTPKGNSSINHNVKFIGQGNVRLDSSELNHHDKVALKIYRSITSATFIHDVRKSPDVRQSYRISDAGKNKLHLT